MPNNIIVKVLGIAQDAGVPQASCYCQYCREARSNPYQRQLVASLALIDESTSSWYLIDSTPSLPEQLALMQEQHPELGLMKGIFLTHAHIGHYTGLMYLGKEAVATTNVPVWCGEGMSEILKNHVPWKQLVDLNNIRLESLADNTAIELAKGLTVKPLLVPHRNEFSETFGFIIEGPQRKLLYIPDIDRWTAWDTSLLSVVNSVDYSLLDATFFSTEELVARGRDYVHIPHPLVTTTMDLLQTAADSSKYISFIHLNHTNPLLQSDSPAFHEVAKRGFHVAKQGEGYSLSF